MPEPLCPWCPNFDRNDPRNAGLSHKMCERCATDFEADIDRIKLELAIARAGTAPGEPTIYQLKADYANALAIIEVLRHQREVHRKRIVHLEGSIDYLRYLVDHPVQQDVPVTIEQAAALAFLDGFR